jgi:hypothetical protein
MVLTLIGGLVDLSLTQATRGTNPKEKMKIEEVRRQGGCHPIFKRAILHSLKCPWIHKS